MRTKTNGVVRSKGGGGGSFKEDKDGAERGLLGISFVPARKSLLPTISADS